MSYNLFLDDARIPEMASFYVLPVEERPKYMKLHWITVRDFDQFREYSTDFHVQFLLTMT
jgi:hypothetical protein